MTHARSPIPPDARRVDQDPTSIRDLSDELYRDLAAAQERRDQRPALAPSGQPEWVAYERGVMIDSTIALLIRHQLPIDADETTRAVGKAEQSASGHSDYTRTWAIGCAHHIASLAHAKQEER